MVFFKYFGLMSIRMNLVFLNLYNVLMRKIEDENVFLIIGINNV